MESFGHGVGLIAVAMVAAMGCGGGLAGEADNAGDATAGLSTTRGTSGGDTHGAGSRTSTNDGTSTGFTWDVGGGNSDAPPAQNPECQVVDGGLDAKACGTSAPADSFDADVQWAWAGDGEYTDVVVTPLVANLTDDNGDGWIDLCDTPDVAVIVYKDQAERTGYMYVLDGATGASHFRIDTLLDDRTYPAIGDFDDDGLPEIVAMAAAPNMPSRLVAFEHDGTPKWTGDMDFVGTQMASALADLDNDGDVEIIHGGEVFDHEGKHLWSAGFLGLGMLPTAADLDGDEDLEVIMGSTAYHHDGSAYYSVNLFPLGHPQVADLDDDDLPEILLVGTPGLAILEHDGAVKVDGIQTTLSNQRPAAIHDMDGDGAPEVVVGAADSYSLLETDLSQVWTAVVSDYSGAAAGTAFDFLGDGSAEAMYADETTLFIFGEAGTPLATRPRSSWTSLENPVVADVDNDGSAEIVVVSNHCSFCGGTNDDPPVQVIRDAQDRWIPARRIWNQHTYHVTNVREDATIPQFEPKHWLQLNTFRTQAQQESGTVCRPPT